ncbi:hypothetical protein MKW94_026112 [Papaver nudicaule]|uniref:Amino acid transporter transmembrane domain-containing protein n=1 Tax=Papaver nudicaule TaxID=74823 RepID=A0AA41VX24_PAPNU|nr:hypothetical protein [Papaver nudicaule]
MSSEIQVVGENNGDQLPPISAPSEVDNEENEHHLAPTATPTLLTDGAPEVVERAGKSNFFMSVINMSAILMGLGQLSTPYALEKGGWASSFLLVAFGVMCAYTSHLLGRYIGGSAFGPRGKIITTVFIYLEVFMALVSFTIAINDNIGTLLHGKHENISWKHHLSFSQILTILAVVISSTTLWIPDLSRFSPVSLVGIICSFVIFIGVVSAAIFGDIKADKPIPVLRLQNIPAISGLYIFSLSTHVVFPDIYRSMKDPSRFSKVSALSFTIVTAFYTAIAFLGARLYGSTLHSQITLNLPRHLITTPIALGATVLAPITKYGFALVPLASLYVHRLPSTASPRKRLIIRGSIGTVLLMLICVLALTVPYFEQVLGLTGSFVSMAVAIIFPCAFYTKLFWAQISRRQLILNAFIIVIAFVIGGFGTVSSSQSLVSQIRKK